MDAMKANGMCAVKAWIIIGSKRCLKKGLLLLTGRLFVKTDLPVLTFDDIYR